MRSDYYVYTWTRPDTGAVFYVGKGQGYRDTSRRGRNKHFMRILNKLDGLGLEPIIERIADNLTEQEALDLERAEIARIGRKADGGTLVNRTDGGEGVSGLKHSAASRAKMSASQSGRKHTPETIAKMRVAQKGRVITPEARAKQSITQKGKVHTAETREAMSFANHMSGPKGGAYKGVNFDRSKSKWLARIYVDDKQYNLGRYTAAEQAARVYDKAAIDAWGIGNCYLNFPADALSPANDNGQIPLIDAA